MALLDEFGNNERNFNRGFGRVGNAPMQKEPRPQFGGAEKPPPMENPGGTKGFDPNYPGGKWTPGGSGMGVGSQWGNPGGRVQGGTNPWGFNRPEGNNPGNFGDPGQNPRFNMWDRAGNGGINPGGMYSKGMNGMIDRFANRLPPGMEAPVGIMRPPDTDVKAPTFNNTNINNKPVEDTRIHAIPGLAKNMNPMFGMTQNQPAGFSWMGNSVKDFSGGYSGGPGYGNTFEGNQNPGGRGFGGSPTAVQSEGNWGEQQVEPPAPHMGGKIGEIDGFKDFGNRIQPPMYNYQWNK